MSSWLLSCWWIFCFSFDWTPACVVAVSLYSLFDIDIYTCFLCARWVRCWWSWILGIGVLMRFGFRSDSIEFHENVLAFFRAGVLNTLRWCSDVECALDGIRADVLMLTLSPSDYAGDTTKRNARKRTVRAHRLASFKLLARPSCAACSPPSDFFCRRSVGSTGSPSSLPSGTSSPGSWWPASSSWVPASSTRSVAQRF